MTVWLSVLAFSLLALPESQQYTARSLPSAIGKIVAGSAAADDIYRVRRFRGESETLWVVTLPCAGDGSGHACKAALFLERVHSAPRDVGQAMGDLVDESGEGPLPSELYFHVREAPNETRLRWRGDHYETKSVPHLFRDPLTRDRMTGRELRDLAFGDLKEGRFASAAGRYSLLCEDACQVLDVEATATAFLEARLFPNAEASLKRAVAMSGHQAQDWASLASLLRAQGRNAEATEAEQTYAREKGAEGPGPDGGRP